MKRRVALMAAVLAVCAVGIVARLFYLQVISYDDLMREAQKKRVTREIIPAKRGDLVDRRGRVATTSVDLPTIFADPEKIEDPDQAIEHVCSALQDCPPALRQTLLDRFTLRRRWARIKRQASLEEARRVADLDLPWIHFEFESRRVYPNGDLAAHLLGYVTPDHKAHSGVELALDRVIKGETGTVIEQRDGQGNVFNRQIVRTPTAGSTIELTIDLLFQSIVERELRAAVEENRASGGSVVVMQPRTGEILAMAGYPTFNPNEPQRSRDVLHNRAVEYAYEPGSTFKIVIASAALEDGIVTPGELIDVSGGRIVLGPSDEIRDLRNYGILSFTDVIANSSNVGTIKVARKVGAPRLIEWVRRFGFGQVATHAFRGEASGIVRDISWLQRDSALARVAIGYMVSVTPVQMAAAVSSIANGGERMEPRIVRAIIENDQRRPIPPKVVNRTVTPQGAAQVTALMEAVVESGTATYAQIPGYTVAAKTGTAEKLVGRDYSKTEHNASVVGFVPSRAPEFTIVVVIDSPHGPNGHFGGPVAGPVFKRIGEALLREAGVPRTVNPPPVLLVKRRPDGVHERPASGPATVSAVVPPAGVRADADGLPDLRGLNARDALAALNGIRIETRLRGVGFVLDQRPAPGAAFEPGDTVTLWLGLQPMLRPVGAAGRP
jgi:cell division protein FtsI (penicillin-binding protein 3)